MKNVIAKLCLVFILIAGISCNNAGKKGSSSAPAALLTGFQLDERLAAADSLVIVFYDDPYSEDSLRYTRFYKQVSLFGKEAVSPLMPQLNMTFNKEEKRACRTEGKIWCFTKGKVFQTLYFSTKCEDCCFVYMIRDGNLYYSKITADFMAWLAGWKPQATVPPTS